MQLTWKRTYDGNYMSPNNLLYEVRWKRYGKTGKSWEAFYDGLPISLAFGARLRDVQRYAQEHADGKRGNVA